MYYLFTNFTKSNYKNLTTPQIWTYYFIFPKANDMLQKQSPRVVLQKKVFCKYAANIQDNVEV